MNLQPNSNLGTSISKSGNSLPAIGITRFHTKRPREVYRSAGWPFQDTVEIELIAAGLLERTSEPSGHDKIRVTANGLAYLAQSIQKNRQNRSAHELLVDRIAQTMLRDGPIVWTNLSLRARLPSEPETPNRWKICNPDVFSIRHTSVASNLEPIVHEIKVSRADLLGDLKSKDKRDSYPTSNILSLTCQAFVEHNELYFKAIFGYPRPKIKTIGLFRNSQMPPNLSDIK